MPMRVKTPWIDALTKSREEAAQAGKESAQAAPSVKPDLTPKKMSDSYYSAVCINPDTETSPADKFWYRFCLWRKISGFWIIISMLRVTFVLGLCLWTWMLLLGSLRTAIQVTV